MESSLTPQLISDHPTTPEAETMLADEATSFDEFKDQQFGKAGTSERIDFQAKALAYRVGGKLREYRKAQKMTQEDLAKKNRHS